MPRKKSIRKSARDYVKMLKDVKDFIQRAKSIKALTKKDLTWLYEYALIKVYRGFEQLMLECLVGALNNDTSVLTARTGITFPKHLTDEICEFLVVGTGYFDFKGRDGLIAKLKDFLPANHYLINIVKKNKYKDALNRLVAFRNYAVHSSKKAKDTAKRIVDQNRLGEAGTWLKTQGRLESIIDNLKELAEEIDNQAPY